MTKQHHARNRGLGLAAKITGIAGIAIAASALAEARAAAADKPDEEERTTAEPVGERALKGQTSFLGGCGCSPCWGPPAPPARGVAS